MLMLYTIGATASMLCEGVLVGKTEAHGFAR
jgi:hypothetical protein